MPIITVWGLPKKTSEDELQAICRDCAKRACAIEELALTEKQMTFLFPPDMMALGLGEEIIVFVDGLFTKPERTDEVRNRLAETIGTVLKAWFPTALVEVLVRPFDPAQGFWTSNKKG